MELDSGGGPVPIPLPKHLIALSFQWHSGPVPFSDPNLHLLVPIKSRQSSGKKRHAMISTHAATATKVERRESAELLNVLIVDDDRSARESCRQVVEELGF